MDEIVKLHADLIRELRNLSLRLENKDIADILPFLLKYKFKNLKDKIYLYNLSNQEEYSPNDFILGEVRKSMSAIPLLDKNFIDSRIDLLNNQYFDKYLHYKKPIPPEKGIHSGFIQGDFEEPDSFISCVGENLTLESMKKLYPTYIEDVESTLKMICDMFSIARQPNSIRGYRSVYDKVKLRIVYKEYRNYIITNESNFINLLVGERGDKRIKVTFSKSKLQSFLLKLYPSGMVDSSCTIKNTFSMFTNSDDGLPMKTNNTNANGTAFQDDLDSFFDSL